MGVSIKEDLYKHLIDNSRELICLHTPNGAYEFVSASSKSITGYSPEELIGKNPYIFFHPDDIKAIQEKSHHPSLDGEEVPFIEYRFKTKSGKYVWLQTLTTPILNENQKVENLLTSSRDISNIKLLQEKLDSKEMLLEEASFLSQVGAWELDAETLQLVQSKVFMDILKVDSNQQLDLEKSLQLFPEDARNKISSCVDDALKNGTSWDLILPIFTLKNNSIWIRSIGRSRMVEGKVRKVYGVIQDVTNHIETQMKLESVVHTLTKQKNHLEDFNHIISHNLRSPVKNLSLLVTHLEEQNKDEGNRELIGHIKKVSHSINELLDDLVDVVKVIQNEDLKIEKVDLNQVMKKSKTILNGQIQQLHPEILADLSSWFEIEYPKIYLESIVLNLLSNSLKYSSPGRTPKIKFKTFISNGRKGFTISDNGLGIDLKKNGKKVFKLNRTFHKNINGKGMGLFMTKKQVQSMGGEISLKSKPDKGTEFKVLLEKG